MQTPITKALEKKFNTDLTFDSVDIWQDKPGYYLGPHTDDLRIKLALQFYLGNDNNVGTSLFDKDDNVLKHLKKFDNVLKYKKKINIYGNLRTINDLKKRFAST